MNALTTSTLPAFGEADLSNCEREQIHLAGSIQPHGAILCLDDPATTIVQASANAAAFLNLGADPVGRQLASLPGTIAARIRAHLDAPLHRRPVALSGSIGEPSVDVEVLLHRPPDGGIVVEFEPASPSAHPRDTVEHAAQAILGVTSLRALGDETAALVERLTGYDRVMVYRFDELGHGEVFSERCKPDLEAFLGNRYPASDIPQIARRLYLQTRVRLLVDNAYTPVPLVPRMSPLTGRDLDMSMCGLRSISPVHVQYLKNMGVRATLVISLVVGGTLWGLVACHHYAPRFVGYETRAICEIVAELVATRITTLESAVQTHSELIVRRLDRTMIEAIGRDGDWRGALFDGSAALLESLRAEGAALVYEGQVRMAGDVPSTSEIRRIAAWLDTKPRDASRDQPFATATLAADAPAFSALVPVAAGLLATPVSATPGEWLLWFRPERRHTVVWGGDPTKPVIVGTDPAQLSPRLSFAQWHQLVEGTSDPWTRADLTTARLIGNTIADMVLQFRSVRMLIAKDQLDTLSRQVRFSTQPMIVADPIGRILIVNDAFEALLQPGHPSLQRLEDLPQLLAEPMAARRHIDDLMRDDRFWRGELALASIGVPSKPLAVRAEPVYAAPDRKLGYVLHFDAIAGRKAAEAARRQFQDGMIDRRVPRSERLDGAGDRDYQAALAAVVENAQLAALEITYGIDAEIMPQMLEAVRGSVARTADLLEHLIWHTGEQT